MKKYRRKEGERGREGERERGRELIHDEYRREKTYF
jgi:hypothetical protein